MSVRVKMKPSNISNSQHLRRNIEGDITVNSKKGLIKSNLIAVFVRVDCRVRTFLLVLKAWQKARHLNNVPGGLINSYCLSDDGLGSASASSK